MRFDEGVRGRGRREPAPSSDGERRAPGELRDADGLLLDEYTSAAYGTPDALDALDVPFIRLAESVLESLPAPEEEVTGVIESEYLAVEESPAEMGLAAEPHSADELAEAAIGHELRGPRGVTRESQLHGERLLDAPEASAG